MRQPLMQMFPKRPARRYWRARHEMLLATDTSWAPCYGVRSDDERRARLNALIHILSKIPYERPP
jgi:polyphosphate kinase